MKKSFMLRMVVIFSMGLLVSACRNTDQAHQRPDGTTLTGSYIPQDVQRNGQFYNGQSHVRTLDQNDIDNTGAATPRELLRKQGVAP